LKIKKAVIERKNGIFFGAMNPDDTLELVQQKVNEEDLYKVVKDPVSADSDYYGYIGFKWRGE